MHNAGPKTELSQSNLNLLRLNVRRYHLLIDNDAEGRAALKELEESAGVVRRDVTVTSCQGMTNSEFEDLIDPSVYRDLISAEIGVSVDDCLDKLKFKWSDRLGRFLEKNGKGSDTKRLVTSLKKFVVESVRRSPESALHPARKDVILSMFKELEAKL